MGDYDLRVPELGESLRPRTPHLVPPEELQLHVPPMEELRLATPPAAEDVLRAHAGDVEEHEAGEHHGPHVHIEAGLDGLEGGVAGRVGAGVEIPIGPNFAIEAEGGVAGLGSDHPTGDVGAEARIGPESGTHGTIGVEAEHLGSEHPEILGAAGLEFGERGGIEARGGAVLGDHPSGMFDVGGSLRLDPHVLLRGRVGMDGLGTEHPGASAGGGIDLEINEHLTLTGGVDAGRLGTDHPEVIPSVGARFTF